MRKNVVHKEWVGMSNERQFKQVKVSLLQAEGLACEMVNR